jgi:hypothetical protein
MKASLGANKVAVLALALAFMASAALGASAYLLMGTATISVQEPVTVNAITDSYPARTTASRTYSNVISVDFTKGGFVAGDNAHIKVELVVVDPRIASFSTFTVQIYKDSTLLATITKDTPVDMFVRTVPNPPAAENYNVVITFATGRSAISNFTTNISAQVAYVG